MTIFTGHKEKEYSVTPSGLLLETVKTSEGTLMRGTKDVYKFLNWMLKPEIESEKLDGLRKRRLMLKAAWWTIKSGETIRGSFDMAHYQKVINAKNNIPCKSTSISTSKLTTTIQALKQVAAMIKATLKSLTPVFL